MKMMAWILLVLAISLPLGLLGVQDGPEPFGKTKSYIGDEPEPVGSGCEPGRLCVVVDDGSPF